MRVGFILVAMADASASIAAPPLKAPGAWLEGRPLVLARARTCKQVSSCAEAVELWCGGYRRADADNDGIPCENVCPSKEIVDELRRQIGC